MIATPISLFDDPDEATAPRRPRTLRQADTAIEPDCLLTTVEAASILGIGRSKLYELVARGAIRWVKLDRCRRFRRSDLDRYIRSLPVAPA